MSKLPCVGLNGHADARAKRLHPWIFSNELSDSKRFQQFEPGSLVDVLDHRGAYLGTGFVNPKSLISVRILTRERGQEIDAAFFAKKLADAVKKREALYGKSSVSQSTYRAVFGEADFLPGLVIDRFQGAWVLEPHALGMALRKDLLVAAVESVAKNLFEEKPNIYFRTDSRSAGLEGMVVESSLASGKAEAAFAVEDGIRFPIDPLKGQKTGFFFDQRDNRSFFREWVAGASQSRSIHALDLFCHAGAWGLRALKAGAKRATFVDSSKGALESVQAAAKLMGVADKIELLEGDAQEVLKSLKPESFQAISLDPPALIPNKKSIPQGSKHYFDLHLDALRVASAGSLFSTSSCSHHLLEDRFEEIVRRALLESKKSGSVIRRGGLSADHPFLAGMEEGRYLKNLSLTL